MSGQGDALARARAAQSRAAEARHERSARTAGWDGLDALLGDPHMSTRAIAAVLGMTPRAALYWRRRAGYGEMRPHYGTQVDRSKPLTSALPEAYARALRALVGKDPARLNASVAAARDAGWTVIELAAALGVATSRIHQRIHAGRARPDAPIAPPSPPGVRLPSRSREKRPSSKRRAAEDPPPHRAAVQAVSARIPVAVVADLDRLAELAGVTRSSLLATAAAEYVRRRMRSHAHLVRDGRR